MKKYLMFIFLLLFCSTLSTRYIFDGKIVFSKHGTSRDRFAYLIIEREDGTVEDTFAIIDTLGNVYWKNYKVYAEFDSLKTGVIWTLSGDRHYFVLTPDTAYIEMTDGTVRFHTNASFAFSGGGPALFYGDIRGIGDGGDFKTEGAVWGIDQSNTERYAHIFFHGNYDEKILVDSIGEIFEWTGRGGFLATELKLIKDIAQTTDTLHHIQADTSGTDRNMVGLLIDGEAINDVSDSPIKVEDKDDNILFLIRGDGTTSGDILNDQFAYQCAGDIFNIATNTVALLGWITPTETEQDLSPHNHDFDYHNFTSPQFFKGLVWSLLFYDASSHYLSTIDHNDFTFDDAGSSEGFTMGGWVEVIATTTKKTLWSKWDESIGSELREWQLYIDEAEKLVMMLYDESADADPYRTSDAILPLDWHLIGAVYDGRSGSVAASGITFYVDGVVVASTATNDITYVGMENTDAQVFFGAIEGPGGTNVDFLKGYMGHQFITTDQLTADQWWSLYLSTRGYYSE